MCVPVVVCKLLLCFRWCEALLSYENFATRRSLDSGRLPQICLTRSHFWKFASQFATSSHGPKTTFLKHTGLEFCGVKLEFGWVSTGGPRAYFARMAGAAKNEKLENFRNSKFKSFVRLQAYSHRIGSVFDASKLFLWFCLMVSWFWKKMKCSMQRMLRTLSPPFAGRLQVRISWSSCNFSRCNYKKMEECFAPMAGHID